MSNSKKRIGRHPVDSRRPGSGGRRGSASMLSEKAKKIKFLLLDVDGVMTDGRIYVGDGGEEFKAFHIHDGMGISLLHKAGIQVGIISGRSSRSIEFRAKELSIKEVHQGIIEKIKAYDDILKRHQLTDEQVAYIGDDLVDRPILRRAGLSVAVANALGEVKENVDWVTTKRGGEGAVREVADLLLKSQGKWPKLFET